MTYTFSRYCGTNFWRRWFKIEATTATFSLSFSLCETMLPGEWKNQSAFRSLSSSKYRCNYSVVQHPVDLNRVYLHQLGLLAVKGLTTLEARDNVYICLLTSDSLYPFRRHSAHRLPQIMISCLALGHFILASQGPPGNQMARSSGLARRSSSVSRW